jgi:branched-chain amino acid transport system permease protein
VENFLQLLVGGIATGSIYGLVALGFVLVYKATDVFNFAHGDFMTIGAYLLVTLVVGVKLPFAAAFAFVLLLAALMGLAVQFTIIRPMLGRPLLAIVMVTIGVSLVLRALILIAYGSAERVLPTPLPQHVFIIGGVRVSSLDLTIMAVSAICVALFALFFRFTNLGLHMRATAEHHTAAVLSGIDANRIFGGAWAIGVTLAAIGGSFIANIQVVGLTLGNIGLLAFPAAVIGGLQSIPGAIVGGLIVGILEKMGEGYVSEQAKDVVVYIGLLVMLLVRPYGLFGQRDIVRV